MKKLESTVVGLVAMVGVCFGSFLAVRGLLHWVASLKKEQAVAAVGIFGLVITPLVSYVTTRAIENRKLSGQAALDHKIGVYEQFVQIIISAVGLGDAEKISEDQIQARLSELAPSMMIYASNQVLKEWRTFRNISGDTNDGRASLFQMESVIRAMRKDLGHGSLTSMKGDILAVFVNDIEDNV